MYLLFDIGGTKTRVAVSADHKKIEKIKVFPTPSSFEEAIERIKETALELSNGESFSSGAGSVATPLDKEKKSVFSDSKKKTFTDWVGKPLKEELEKSFSIPIFLENDATMGGLGEAVFGPGKDKSIVMFMTISTGIGGSKIVNGKIDENSFGFEPGKQVIDPDGTLVPSDTPPLTLNEFLGGTFIEERQGKSPENIDDEEFWGERAKFLAMGLSTSIVHWSPEIVVLGGSLMNKISIEKVRENLSQILTSTDSLPKIELGTLGDKCGLFGALHYLNTKE